jgi:hypothetical protein
MAMTPEQAQLLFDQGKINEETLAQVNAQNPLPASEPQQIGGSGPVSEPGIPSPFDTQLQSDITAGTTQPGPTVQPSMPEPTPEPMPIIPAAPSMVTTTTTEKRATEAAQEAQDKITQALEAQKAALEEQTRIGMERATETQAFNQETQRIQQEAAKAEQALRSQGMAEIESRMAELDSKTAALGDRKYEGYWADKGTGTKILGAISLALGAYAQAMGGGPNTALKIINGAMAEDFNKFQANTKIKMDAINRSRLGIDAKRRLLADQVMNLQAKKQADLNIVQAKVAELQTKFQNPEMKAKLDGLQAQLDMQAAQQRAKFEQSLAQTVTTKVSEQRGAQAAGIDRELFVPGLGQALTKQDAKELKKAFVTKQDLDSKLKELIALRKTHGGEVFDREAVARGKQLSKELLLKYKDLAKLGVLSESDMSIIEEIIPADPLQFDLIPGQEPTMEKLTNLQNDVNNLFESEVEARLEPGTRVTQFPMTVTKDGMTATVSNEAELSEAQSEGWNP